MTLCSTGNGAQCHCQPDEGVSCVYAVGQTWQKVDPLCPAGFSHLDAWNAAIESAARVLQSANDETSRKCIVDAIRRLSKS